MYTKKSEGKKNNLITWRCVKRDPPVSCPATLHTTKNYENPEVKKTHNHPSDETSVRVTKCRSDMKAKAETTRDKPNQIFTFATSQAPDDVKAHLPSADTCKRVLRRARALHCPSEPQSLQDLNIDGEWAMTQGDNPTRFLLYDNGTAADERIIIFASETHLAQLAASDTWCMDGNFAMAPHIFMQLYVIQARVSNVFLPMIYILLQRKTQTSYEAMFRVLEANGCDPSLVIIDFERSVELAMHAVFGPHVQIQYCFYHLTQSTWRKIQALGLAHQYQTDDEFRIFCGQLDALAFLPPDEVLEGMQHLKDTMPDAAIPLVEYFDQTYVSGQLRQRQPQQQQQQDRGTVAPIRIRRIPPIFPLHNWNMYQVTLAGEARTNNICEGWNNKFSSLVGHQHPSIWKLIECLRAECARVTGVLLQYDLGVRPKKRCKKIYSDLQERLRNLCEDRVSGRKTIPQFLRGVSHNLRGGQPNT